MSVTDFGAVGDGVTDDSAAIAQARSLAASLGEAVWYPVATYLVNTAPPPQPGLYSFVSPGATFSGDGAPTLAAQSSPLLVEGQGTVSAPLTTRLWSLQPTDPSKAPYTAILYAQNFSGVIDDVFFWGYNADNSFLTEPVARWGMEQEYNDGSGDDKMEMYLETFTAGQAHQNRPIFTSLDRVNATSYSLYQWQNASDGSKQGYIQFQNHNGTIVAAFRDQGAFFLQPTLQFGPGVVGAKINQTKSTTGAGESVTYGAQAAMPGSGANGGSPIVSGEPGDGAGAGGGVSLRGWKSGSQYEIAQFAPPASRPSSGTQVGEHAQMVYVNTFGGGPSIQLAAGLIGAATYTPPVGSSAFLQMTWKCRDTMTNDTYGGLVTGIVKNTSGTVSINEEIVIGTNIGDPTLLGAQGSFGLHLGELTCIGSPPAAYTGTLQWTFSIKIVEN